MACRKLFSDWQFHPHMAAKCFPHIRAKVRQHLSSILAESILVSGSMGCRILAVVNAGTIMYIP